MPEIGAAAAAIAATVLKLSKVLYNYAYFLLGVKGRIKRLKRELIWMQSFLKDAENKLDTDSSNLIEVWVSDVRDLAYEAEDVIDTFLLKVTLKTSSLISGIKSIRITHKLGCQLDDLMEKANDISTRRHRYSLSENINNINDTSKSEEKLKELRASTPYAASGEYMIGLSETVSLLQGKLTSGESGRFVISIHGMGGLGKTTLARSLYNILKRQKYFHLYGWICVSQKYDSKAILRGLIRSMTDSNEQVLNGLIAKDSLEAHLRNHLNGRSFLVVIDDVWDPLVLESIQKAFPEDENNKSRVIITTRVEQAAKIKGAYVHTLRYLNEEESWELFRRKCFQYDPSMRINCPQNLKDLGKEMLKKCSGLPLAIVTLGGLLSSKPFGISEWEAVRDNLWDELRKDTDHINAVLALSYKDLSYNLKQCLLYIGIFPEDFEIPISKLMLLWEAENFIGQEEEGGRPEDTTKSYFNELVGRSLLQKTGEDYWHASTCRIHDLLRDLAIKKAKEIDLAFYDGRKPIDLVKTTRHRRLCISNLNPTIFPGDYINCSLRTFNLDAGASTVGKLLTSSDIHVNNLLQSLHKRFSLLRVLDVRVAQGEITNLHVGDMIHLRYIGINCPGVELPENIGNLKALQTISIISNKLTLPETMGKLQNLKHMRTGYNPNWIGKFTWIGKLTCLQTLCISSKIWAEIDDTTSLVNLHHLTIFRDYLDYLIPPVKSKFYSNFESLTRLHTLVFRSLESWISYFEVFKHCRSIRHFIGRINSGCPDFHEFALNLEVLEVIVDNDRWILLPSIQELPKLRALKIGLGIGIATSRPMLVMDCSKHGFAQLQTLHLHIAFYQYRADANNPQMELKVADGGLPLLTNFHVNTPERLIAPDRLKQLITVAP